MGKGETSWEVVGDMGPGCLRHEYARTVLGQADNNRQFVNVPQLKTNHKIAPI